MERKRLFSKKHVWICIEGETATLGVSRHAQEELGEIMFLNLPETGERLKIGEPLGDIESIKTVSELFSPVEGEVIRINNDLVEEPERINENPYESWLVEVKVDKVENELMDEQAYLKYKDE